MAATDQPADTAGGDRQQLRRSALPAWLWLDQKLAAFGWVPLIAGLLAWDYFVWRRDKLRGRGAKVKRWVTKKVLTPPPHRRSHR